MNRTLIIDFFLVFAGLNDFVPTLIGGPILSNNVHISDLDRRLQYRAVSNALSGLVRYCDEMVDKKEESAQNTVEDWYSELLPFIFAKWKGYNSFNVLVWIALTVFATEIICLIVNVVSS